MAVPLRVIVVGVDDDLARQGLDRNLPVVLQRHRNDDNISSLCSVHGGRREGSWTKVRDERGQRLRAAGIADHYIVAVCYRESCDLTSNEFGTDDSDCRGFGHRVSSPTRGGPLLPGSVLSETGPRGTRLSIACVPLLTTGDERLEERFVREFVAIQIVAVGVIL